MKVKTLIALSMLVSSARYLYGVFRKTFCKGELEVTDIETQEKVKVSQMKEGKLYEF